MDAASTRETTTGGRLIAGEAAVALPAWVPPELGERVEELIGAARPRLPTAEEIEALHEAARADGHALGRREGHAEGWAAGRAEGEAALRETSARLGSIVGALASPLEALDETLLQQVAELALLVARHLVRRELRTSPGEVVAVVREAVRQLPVATRHPRLHLNPEDVDIVRDALGLDESDAGWTLEPDPLITRGGCLVETDVSWVDATVEARLAAIAGRMFGGEREADRGR